MASVIGLALLETGEAFATQIAESEIIQTAKALSTSFEGSGLIATAQSIASGDGSALLQTAQYFATHQVPKIQETVKAIATRVPIPGDIPIFPGKRTDDRIECKVERGRGYVRYRRFRPGLARAEPVEG